MKKITSLTPEMVARIPEWVDKWVKNGLSTDPANFDEAEKGVRGCYRASGLPEPVVILRMPSPMSAIQGTAIALGILGKISTVLKSKVHDQVYDQVDDHVRAQVYYQVNDQVDDQVDDHVRAHVYDQVNAQVYDQVNAQVHDQVYAQVDAQVYAQVSDHVRTQVSAQVNDQVYAQVVAQVSAQVNDQVYAQVVAQMDENCKKAFYSYRGGNLWSGWYAYVSFLRDVAGFSGSALEKFYYDELIAKNAGWTTWFGGVAAISDRPKKIMLDDNGRLHSTTGPAILWRDGYSLYAWHGVRIPAEWTKGEFPSAKEMLSWENIEQRRAGCSMMGWARILKEINAKVIDKDPNPLIGTLIEADIPDSGKERFLVVECGTGRKGIVLPVDKSARTALEANASTWGLKANQYKPEVRT